MGISIYKSVRYLLAIFLFVLMAFQTVFATQSLSNEEKIIFSLAKNIGELTYYYTDIASNNQMMGIAMLHGKIRHLKTLMARQDILDNDLNLSKDTLKMFSLAAKNLEESHVKGDYINNKFEKSQQEYVQYSQDLRKDIEHLYGPKYTWLFDTGFLTSFTEHSMRSEYKQKLILLQYRYVLDFIPYELPTSVIASLSKVAVAKDGELTDTQIDMMRESSQNVIAYFLNPEAYAPPATLKTLVGKWEGRLAPPGSDYHKASIIIKPDMTAVLNVEDIFDSMPVNNMTLTQSLLSFDIKPFGEEKLVIKFTGRIVDDVISGEAIDISGKKGLWQFLKAPEITVGSEVFSSKSAGNTPFSFDSLVGTWKGKILEESGAISNAQLNVNLQNEVTLNVQNDIVQDSYSVKGLAVNDNAVKFVIIPKDQDIELTFIGEIKGRIVEGNIEATDGTRGYWKIIKVAGPKPSQKINFLPEDLCDPDVDLPYYNNFLTVAKKKVIVPSGKIFQGKYKGLMTFPDGTEAEIILYLKDKKSKMALISKDDNAKVDLEVSDIKITDREIFFITTIDGNEATKVTFKGKVFGNYIYGKALNSNGSELKWEVAADKIANDLVSNVKRSDASRILGSWAGQLTFSDFIKVPATLEVTNTNKSLILGDQDPLKITDIVLDSNNVSFQASDENNSLTFSGLLNEGEVTGKLSTPDGQTLAMKVELIKPCFNEKLSGIWKGNINSGGAKADIVFDFSCDKGKKVYIDDPKAKSGRLELNVNEFLNKPENLSFVAMVPKTLSKIEFKGKVAKENIAGTAKNSMPGGKTLSWNVSRSNLVEYLPETTSDNLEKPAPKYQETFSFLDVIETNSEEEKVENKISKVPDKKEKQVNIQEKADKTEIKKDDDSEKQLKKEKKKKNKAKKKKLKKYQKRLETSKTPDEAMFKESEVKKAQKQMQKVKEKNTELSKTEKQEKEKEQKVEETKKEKQPEESKSAIEEQTSAVTEKETSGKEQLSASLKPEDLYGKWGGSMSSPQGEEGEILIEIKEGESYIYIDDNGEKKPFKLTDYKLEGKNIYFSIKPSGDDSFVIKFQGFLIQGILSGEATDPKGKKGKWHVKKL